MVVENLTLLIVIAFAAAAIAQLKSLPWAFAGGMIIGLAKAFTGAVPRVRPELVATRPRPSPRSSSSSPCSSCPRPGSRPAACALTKRTERLTTPIEALVGAVVMVGLVVGVGQRLDPVVHRHQLRRAHRRVARPGRRASW